MQLVLVRHGETDWNWEGRYQGQADPPLNAAGRRQAKAVARALMDMPIEAVYSSDLRRAVRTAELIARSHQLSVIQDLRLREISLGAWEGMLSSDIATAYPVEWSTRQTDPLHSRSPGGETITEVAVRVWPAADEIACRHSHGTVVIVSHSLALATLLCKASGIALDQAYHMAPVNASHTSVDWLCGQ